MEKLADLLRAIREFGAMMKIIVKKKPALATTADNTSLLSNVNKATLTNDATAKTTAHAALRNNPHSITAAKLSGVDKAYVDSALGSCVMLADIPVSQFGDTGTASLGITASGFTLQFTKAIPVLLLGSYKLLPARNIALSTITASPANKVFYAYVRAINGVVDYYISTTKLAESIDVMYIGMITTNTSVATWADVNRVTRLGTFRVSNTPRGSAIPATAGTPNQIGTKLNAGWKP